MENVIKALRERLDLSQAALARNSGVDQSRISKMEAGASVPSVETVENLAPVLGVEPMALMVCQGFDVIEKAAKRGDVGPGDVAQKAARLLSMASEAGALTDAEVRKFASIAGELVGIAEQAAGRAATKATFGSVDMYAELDRDSLGLKRKPHQARPGGTESATKGQVRTGESFDMYAALGRDADGTRRNAPKIDKLGHYHLPEESYAGAQGVNPEERQLGRELGGARVRRGPVADGEPGPASRKGAVGADALGRGAGGRKLRKLYD